jgi:hypothetical protein
MTMSDVKNSSGSCLCGTVKFAAQSGNSVGVCHCSMCRKWNGGPQMAVYCGDSVSFENEQSISVYKSSEWAERGFCKNCGSHLFYRLQGNQHMILAGAFNNSEGFIVENQYFIDDKPSFYRFENETVNLTGAETAEKMGLI